MTRRVVSRRSSSFVVVVRTTRVTHSDVSFARTREAGRARGCHSERRRRVASGPGRRTKLETREVESDGARRTSSRRTKNLLRVPRARSGAPEARQSRGNPSAPARIRAVRLSRARVRALGVAILDASRRTRRQPRLAGAVPLNAGASHGKILRASRPGGHAPGSSSCHLLRASPPRRWRSRRGPSSDPSRRFGGSSASGACAPPAVV